MFRVLRRLGVTEASAEDALQDVFFVAWRRRSDFEGRAALRTWLYGIALRVARDYRRQRDRRARERMRSSSPIAAWTRRHAQPKTAPCASSTPGSSA